MKIKKLAWTILPVLLIGCSTNAQTNDNPFNAKHENKKGFEKKLKQPEGLKLSSTLYGLSVAPDPKIFAKEHDIFLSEDRARVFIFFDPASSGPDREKIFEKYKVILEKKSNEPARVLVPINALIPLSKEPVIGLIKLPDKPTP